MVDVAKRNIKQAKKTDEFHECINNRLDEFSEKIGMDAFSLINPDCELGKKLKKGDKISFKMSKYRGTTWRSGRVGSFGQFSQSAYATAHLNGSKEVFFPISIKVEVSPFDFAEQKRREIVEKTEKIEKRLEALPKRFKKNHAANDKLKTAMGMLSQKLSNDDYLYDDDDIMDLIEKSVSLLEKVK